MNAFFDKIQRQKTIAFTIYLDRSEERGVEGNGLRFYIPPVWMFFEGASSSL